MFNGIREKGFLFSFDTEKDPGLIVVAIMAALYCLVMGFSVFFIHNNYLSTHDLAIFDQSFWTTVSNHGFFVNTVSETQPCYFGAHNSPILLALIPFFLLFEHPVFFPLVSTVLLGVAAFPLYSITQKVFSRIFALIIVFIYLVSPSVHGINLYSFSTICFVPLFFFLCWYGMITERWRLYLISGLLLIFVREDIALLVSMIGVYGLVVQPRNIARVKYYHLFLIFSGILFAILSVTLVIPSLSTGITLSENYSLNFLQNLSAFSIQRITLFIQAFGPLLFLPFAAPEVLLVGIFQLFEVFFSPVPTHLSYEFHYPGMFFPVLLLSTVYGIRRVHNYLTFPHREILIRGIETVLIILSLVGFFVMSPLMIYLPFYNQETPSHVKDLDAVLGKIPEDAAIVTQDNIIPHLSHRENIFLYGYHPEADYLIFESITGYADLFTDIDEYRSWDVIWNSNGVTVLANPEKSLRLGSTSFSVN